MDFKPGDKAMVPRSDGSYSEGTIDMIFNGLAIVRFPVGSSYRGKPIEGCFQQVIIEKTVRLEELLPIKKEELN